MHTADIVILVALLLPAVVGAVYGFLNILFSIVAWGLALGICAKFSHTFAPLLEGYVEAELIRDVLAFIGLFVVSLLILTAVGYLIVKLLGRTGLTAADRILGFLFGIGLGGAITAVIVFLAGFTALPREPWWQASILLEPFERIAVSVQPYLPDNVVGYHSYALTEPELEPGRGE
ncbi:MAG: CvpA family protein [Gammaproteobacteria bacterium]|nr:CvpA family protein [Gammaproteobacteria bacterium]